MSYTINIFNTNGEQVNTRSLSKKIFDKEYINNVLLHEFIVMQMANARIPIAHTKTRSEVRGSGKKLYKQKWTGRARVGSADSGIRKWWGVYFGPRNERNFTKKMPSKKRRKALLGALSLKAEEEKIYCLDKFDIENISTKQANNVLKNLWLNNSKTLIVSPDKDELIIKSFRNIPNVKYVNGSYINPYDLLTNENVLFLEKSLDLVEERFSK